MSNVPYFSGDAIYLSGWPHYNYRFLAAETTSQSEPCTVLALHAYSGLQGAYGVTTGTLRLLHSPHRLLQG